MTELKHAIDEATSILIVLPDTASDKDYLAALQIQRIAPDKIRVVAPDQKEIEWAQIFGGSIQKKEFAISINTTLSPVDELRYQKEGDKLVVFLTHQRTFDPTAIQMGAHIPPADLIITTGFANQSSADKAIELYPRKGATRHFWLDNANTNTESITGNNDKKLPQSSAALLGRLMVRSREDHDIDTLWTFITRDDFLRTNSTPTELRPLIETFSRIASLPRIATIFWQYDEHAGTEGILWSTDASVLKRMAHILGSREDSPFVSLGMFSNFIEAEVKIRKLLRELG
ncbi:MAG: hypothetical protein AAB482_01180 [Patescibacteria group bacterium]